jgi:hypothetical protein
MLVKWFDDFKKWITLYNVKITGETTSAASVPDTE